MNKSELVEAVAAKTEMSKSDIDTALSGLFEVVADHVSRTDDKIAIPGWISFQQTTRAPRTGRNPRTGETIQIRLGGLSADGRDAEFSASGTVIAAWKVMRASGLS